MILHSSIRTQLDTQGFCACTVAGASMNPMLREGREVVMIRKKSTPPRVDDVVLYEHDGELVLHRVRKITPKGYLIRGDNSYADHKNVPEAAILGVLEYYVREGERIDCATDRRYRRYVRRRNASYPMRLAIRKILGEA